ncbi:MAG: GTP 3',8-cyclase MoaA [Chitinophagaceae bacterium]|nr:GTP 3',8-cyclase MoaA [Chitinophagaceae bacterium]
MILDNYDRVHDYLRISLTDNCNFRCFYCMPDEDYTFTPHSKLMQVDEVFEIAKQFVSLGVKKIRLTGGEPLVRKDAATIIRLLSTLPVELTMTTNGTRVHDFLRVFVESGIRSLNVSLDTLDEEKFQLITRTGNFHQVMNNIKLLVRNEFNVKVNVVVMKGINDHELLDFIEWTRNEPVQIRFIEFMPFSGNRWSSNQVITMDQMLASISEKYEFIPVQRDQHDTSKKFMVQGHSGSFAVISTMSANFCGDCNRIRLTADGKMKNCLFSKEEVDLLSAYRNGVSLLPLIEQSIKAKAKQLGGQVSADFNQINSSQIENRTMISIGG